MTISVNRKQITTLAKAFDVPGVSYLQKLDLIATSLGFKNQAALMATLNADSASTTGPDPMMLQDWRPRSEIHEGDDPATAPIPFRIETSKKCLEILLDPLMADQDGAHPVRVEFEREGASTNVLIYDSICSAPFIVGVPDGKSLGIIETNWEPEIQRSEMKVSKIERADRVLFERNGNISSISNSPSANKDKARPEPDDLDLVTWPNGDWCYREHLEIYGQHMSYDYVIIPVSGYEPGEEDAAAARAHSWPHSKTDGMEP